jgi:hypothetical protein
LLEADDTGVPSGRNQRKPSIRAEALVPVFARLYGRAVHGYLVERYWPGVSADEVREACLRLTASGSPATTTFLGAVVVAGDETVFFQFTALSGADVIAVCASAGLRCDRLVAADYWEPSVPRSHEDGELGSASDT